MSAPRKRGSRAVYGAGGTMNFQPGPETICWNGLRQSEATLLTKRLLNPAAQKHSAAEPGVVPFAVPGPLSRGIDIAADVGDEILLKKILSFGAVFHRNPGAGKLATAEDDVPLDEAVVTAVDGNGPFQAVIDRVADQLELIARVRGIQGAPEMMDMQGIASDVVGARIERCRARAAEILKLNVVYVYVGAMGEQRVAAGARGIFRTNDDVSREVAQRVAGVLCRRSTRSGCRRHLFAPRWS